MLNSGDIVELNLGIPSGREAGLRRPAVVATAQRLLDASPSVIQVVPLTTTLRGFGSEVLLEPDDANGLNRTSAAQCQHIRAVSVGRVEQVLGNVGRASPHPDPRGARPHPRHALLRARKPHAALRGPLGPPSETSPGWSSCWSCRRPSAGFPADTASPQALATSPAPSGPLSLSSHCPLPDPSRRVRGSRGRQKRSQEVRGAPVGSSLQLSSLSRRSGETAVLSSMQNQRCRCRASTEILILAMQRTADEWRRLIEGSGTELDRQRRWAGSFGVVGAAQPPLARSHAACGRILVLS